MREVYSQVRMPRNCWKDQTHYPYRPYNLLFLHTLDAFRSSVIPVEPNNYLYLPQESQKVPPFQPQSLLSSRPKEALRGEVAT